MQYRFNEGLRFGANIKDINTTLKVNTTINQDDIERQETFYSKFPHDISFGISWQAQPSIELSSDYQFLLGDYGGYNIDIQLWRMGVVYQYEHFSFRVGSLIPIKLHTGLEKNLRPDMPAPLLPTTGIGWKNQRLSFNISLYPHPIMSYQQQAIKLVTESSITIPA